MFGPPVSSCIARISVFTGAVPCTMARGEGGSPMGAPSGVTVSVLTGTFLTTRVVRPGAVNTTE